MDCVACGSAKVTERPERTAQAYRRFRCRTCRKQYSERSGIAMNHAQYLLRSVAAAGNEASFWMEATQSNTTRRPRSSACRRVTARCLGAIRHRRADPYLRPRHSIHPNQRGRHPASHPRNEINLAD
jgi:hypothetical protein